MGEKSKSKSVGWLARVKKLWTVILFSTDLETTDLVQSHLLRTRRSLLSEADSALRAQQDGVLGAGRANSKWVRQACVITTTRHIETCMIDS